MSPLMVIQRGHVPRTRGSTGTAGEQEQVTKVSEHIAGVGRRIPDLAAKVDWDARLINADEATSRYAGDAFVALHCDGSTSSSANGASVGYRTDAGARLGAAWKAAYKKSGWPGAFRSDNYTDALRYYYGTGRAASAGTSPAMILEFGFLTNPTDRAWLHANVGAQARSVVWAIAGKDPGGKGVITPSRPSDKGTIVGLPINKGDKGDDVRYIQELLRQRAGTDAVSLDKHYGPNVATVVGKVLQWDHGYNGRPVNSIGGGRLFQLQQSALRHADNGHWARGKSHPKGKHGHSANEVEGLAGGASETGSHEHEATVTSTVRLGPGEA